MIKAGVVVFPGSNCDKDCAYALEEIAGAKVQYVWHKETSLPKLDLVVLPGGFSYGDYLRTGAIARFSPIFTAVKKHAAERRGVIGICNGFQMLLESGLLPGAMLRNRSLQFICKNIFIRTENPKTLFTNQLKKSQLLNIPIAHGEGNYFCDQETLKELRGNGRIIFRYASESGQVNDASNPNGSVDSIAGIMNDGGNVMGMMPHPERASEDELGSRDGFGIWKSLLTSLN